MADQNLPINLPTDQNIDHHLVTILEKLESIRQINFHKNSAKLKCKALAQVEVRSLEFWRSVTSECLASFVYVFVVCGAAAGAGVGANISSVLLATALASGFAMTSLTQCFGHISGAHVNPAVSVAMLVTKKITYLRTVMFIIAQCGGGIAGAAFLYGVSVPGYQGNLSAAVAHSANIAPWERFGIEFILTFVIVFSYFVSMDSLKRHIGTSAITIGSAYSACSFVSMPYLNPARSLGPSFVLNKWEHHWVYWLGPMLGGIASGLIYEYIFNPNRSKELKHVAEVDSLSMSSDEDNYDDLNKPNKQPKFHGSTYNTYRSAGGGGGGGTTASAYCASLPPPSLYSAPTKLERVESLYGGTKSLYCKSPPLTRANLNRSQSVYTKSNSAVNRDIIPKPGPLVPAQSLYPIRLNQQSHVQNQNVQNQIQQRTEGIYGVRGVTPGTATRADNYPTTERVYGTRSNTQAIPPVEQTGKYESEHQGKSGRRPESMYGLSSQQSRRGQSDDSSYTSSYNGTNPRNIPTASSSTYHNGVAGNYPPQKQQQQQQKTGVNAYPGAISRNASADVRQSPPNQLLSTASNSSSYHHQHPQHSPNSQY